MSTGPSQLEEIARRYFAALRARDLDEIDALAEAWYAENFVLHIANGPDLGRGPAALKAFTRGLLANYSDIHITIEDFFSADDKTATRYMVRATDATTGKTTSAPGMSMGRMAGEKMVELWELLGPRTEQV